MNIEAAPAARKAEITLTDEQASAVDRIMAWWRRPPWQRGETFVLYGYAGTGKTTLVRWIADAIEHEGGKPVIAAYTGKAAEVLRRKVGRDTATLHSLLYNFCGTDDDGEPMFSPKEWSEVRRCGLFIIDECSMVPGWMMEKALEHGVPILAVGDPAQLPPVRGEAWFHKGHDAMLTEIHRQAWDSPIIRAATKIRNGEPDAGLSLLQRRSRADAIQVSEVVDGAQILCFTNAWRRRVNANVRRLVGYPDWRPRTGERVIGLRNNRLLGMLNGEMYGVADSRAGDSELFRLRLEGRRREMLAYAAPLRGEDPPRELKPDVGLFDWGYCVTVHKAQGSEWPTVVLFDDYPEGLKGRARWLYTGVTRASEDLIYVR